MNCKTPAMSVHKTLCNYCITGGSILTFCQSYSLVFIPFSKVLTTLHICWLVNVGYMLKMINSFWDCVQAEDMAGSVSEKMKNQMYHSDITGNEKVQHFENILNSKNIKEEQFWVTFRNNFLLNCLHERK